jgi:2-oxoglutarate ferredoxin oxidoreductase subunit delta
MSFFKGIFPAGSSVSVVLVQNMIEINEELCKGCEICTDFCPREVLATSHAINKRGNYLPAVIREDKCSGCKQCELMCPDFAITVFKE